MYQFKSVSELIQYISISIQEDIRLSSMSVCGEITGFKRNSQSGHCYFALKDQDSYINCVMFSSKYQLSRIDAKDGMQVEIRGTANVYSAQGKLQIVVSSMKQIGVGNLMESYRQLGKKLKEEGLFNNEYKSKLPMLPSRIGVITSASGAVIMDIIRTLRLRNPHFDLLLYPASVQGETAATEVINGLDYFDSLSDDSKPDVIIIARGGGSFEDLFCFNDEALIRRVFAHKTPVISAIGHETDFTLLDYVADVRAATPTAAAQIVIPSYQELEGKLNSYFEQLSVIINNKLDRENLRVQYCKNHKALLSITYTLESQLLRLDKDKSNLYDSFCKLFVREEERLKAYKRELVLNEKKSYEDNANRLLTIIKQIEALGPMNILRRGYSYLLDTNASSISTVNNVSVGDDLKIILSDGELDCEVTNIISREE